MDHLRGAVAVCLLALVGPALAGYASAVPPAGWGGSAATGWTFQKAANEAWTAAKTVRTDAALNVGGRIVKVPASLSLAANAPRFIARAAWGHPLILAGSVAAPYLLDWARGKGFWIDEDLKQWVKPADPNVCSVGPCYEYKGRDGLWYPTGELAAATWLGPISGCGWQQPIHYEIVSVVLGGAGWYAVYKDKYCGSGTLRPDGWWTDEIREVEPGVVEPLPVGQEEFEETLKDWPMPWQVPNEVPDVGWPVELPRINPDADPWPAPLPVPVGAPVPVPDTDPQAYDQPIIDIRPAPTLPDPWRVDVSDRIERGTDPEGAPEGVPVSPAPPAEPAPGLCELNPQAAACQPLGDAADEPELAEHEVSGSITPVDGFGASTAECPAPRTATLAGGLQVAMPFDLFCQFADGIRPVVIAMAWLAAAVSFAGLARRGSA